MKITKADAVALFVALGFSKAAGWSAAKLQERVGKLGDKVKEESVPDEHKELFGQVTKAKDVEVTDDEAEEEEEEEETEEEEEEDEEVDVDTLDLAGLRSLVEERELAIKGAAKKNIEVLRVEVKKALKKGKGGRKSSVDRAVDKAAGKKGGKPTKGGKPEKKKDERPKDEYGSVEGSIRAKVNKAFSKKWKTDEQIAEEADVTLKQARIRLRRAVKKGLLEKQSSIQYRLKSAESADE